MGDLQTLIYISVLQMCTVTINMYIYLIFNHESHENWILKYYVLVSISGITAIYSD